MSSFINLSKNVEATIKDTSADPHPYGYFGFGLTCILFGICNANFFAVDSMILAMALFFGGLCQILGGILCNKKGYFLNGFAFVAWGFFWISYAIMTILANCKVISAPGYVSQAWYLAVWATMTVFMWINSIYYLELAVQFFYFSVFLWMYILAFGYGYAHLNTTIAGGWFGIFCGVLAFYCGSAHIVSFEGKKLIPLGENYCCSRKRNQDHQQNHAEEQIKGGLEAPKTGI